VDGTASPSTNETRPKHKRDASKMWRHTLLRRCAPPLCAVVGFHSSSLASGSAAPEQPTARRAQTSASATVDPPPPKLTLDRANMLGRQWVAEESQPGYVPPSASWPPPEEQPRRSDIPVLKKALAQCGGTESAACHGVAFALSVALIGGSLFGHSEHDDTERTDDERTIGADLMHTLAERGSPAGMCGWACASACLDPSLWPLPHSLLLGHACLLTQR
jgi:hypothetical protein